VRTFCAITIPLLTALCAWADAPKPTGAIRDAAFCQYSVPTPANSLDSRHGYFADKLDSYDMPICRDLRGGIRF